MIRLFVLIGVIGGTAIVYLATYGVGPEAQLPPEISQLAMFEEEGLVPNANDLEENPAMEGGIFEAPSEDEAQLAIAMEEFAQMDMGGMDMSSGAGMSDTEMGEMTTGTAEPAMNMESESTMEMGSEGSTEMDMAETAPAAMDMAETAPAAMDMGSTDMAEMATDAVDNMSGSGDAAMDMGEGGLLISEDGQFDREIKLTMTEWGYSDMEIDVKMGERIKFTVTNGGQIPHEFMFMNMPLMSAVNYRLARADWSLLEHEALFEQSLVLPGGEFTFVVQITEPGSWMFMCMLPYHMQMGMMGQMSTEGAAMQM